MCWEESGGGGHGHGCLGSRPRGSQAEGGMGAHFCFFPNLRPCEKHPHGRSLLQAVGMVRGHGVMVAQPALCPPTPHRGVEGSGGRSVLLFCIIGWFRGQRLQVLGMRVDRPAWGLRANATGRARCQSACGEVGVGQERVEATEPVGPWLKTGPTSPKCLRVKAGQSGSQGRSSSGPSHPHPSASGDYLLRASWSPRREAEGLIRGPQKGDPQG